MGIQHLNSNASAEEILEILDADAGVIIDNVLSSDQIDRINSDLEPYLKNTNEGQDEFTGFNTRRVGPKDGEDWVGGNYTTAVGLEAQLPNLLPESTKTDFSVFLDAGNIWGVDYSNAIDETNKIRTSVGISANVFTTIGPLTFTFAQDLSKSTNDETESFNFRLGTSF